MSKSIKKFKIKNNKKYFFSIFLSYIYKNIYLITFNMDNIQAIYNALNLKAPLTDGVSSLQKNDSTISSLLLTSIDTSANLSVQEGLFNINLNNNPILSANESVFTIFNNLNIYDTLKANNITIKNNASINEIETNNLNVNVSISLNSDLRVNNNIYTNNLNTLNNDNIINISNDNTIINIGNCNYSINFLGKINNVEYTVTKISNPKIILNSSNLNGGDSGILINGVNGYNGYIKTNLDGTYFLIKPPNGIENIIATLDTNYNMYITGSSILNGNTTILSDLYVSGFTILNNATILSSISLTNDNYIENMNIENLNVLNNITILSSLYISGVSNINKLISNNCTINTIFSDNIIYNNGSNLSYILNKIDYSIKQKIDKNDNLININNKLICNNLALGPIDNILSILNNNIINNVPYWKNNISYWNDSFELDNNIAYKYYLTNKSLLNNINNFNYLIIL